MSYKLCRLTLCVECGQRLHQTGRQTDECMQLQAAVVAAAAGDYV